MIRALIVDDNDDNVYYLRALQLSRVANMEDVPEAARGNVR